MQESIQPQFTWSHERICAGGVKDVALLVEWKGIKTAEQCRKNSHKVAASEIELRIWFEPHVKLCKCHGCSIETREGQSVSFKLGKILSGQRKYIGLEFTMAAMPAGKHEAIWLQWQYKQPFGERIRELSVIKLGLEHTHHTSVLRDSSSFIVEKHMELLKTEEALEDAAELRKNGQILPAYEKLRRHADKLLLLATRSGDYLLFKEAEKLYEQNKQELQQSDNIAGILCDTRKEAVSLPYILNSTIQISENCLYNH
ncbi:hypothetical protein H1230_14845 [Paenibacillus sp. 19GGS1-52]|uniref:hypothetical protein n=1 Tax=Paenibacillus sp. 19GGS1-52 TaxID=2758563 RepID=UPI001EFC23EF|nr:hypothetical protein [Paenibacillus sp. 19GGS1-52]ULO09927.1 hypothetical protein H1230_14845 [Paenibacillus sp. 19GGS1-52]